MPAINHSTSLARFDPAAKRRNLFYAKINIARQQIGIVEDDYRQGLLTATGQISLKDCSEAQLEAMLGWMQSKGFKPIPKKGGPGSSARAQHPMARKARALWISLYQLGVVHNPAEPALEAFAARQLGCERMVWARQSDAYKLIEALKAMARRAGWQQHGVNGEKLAPLALQANLCHLILAKLKEAGAVPADWLLHEAMFRLCGIENGKAAPWSAEDYARLAGALGAKLRELGDPRDLGQELLS